MLNRSVDTIIKFVTDDWMTIFISAIQSFSESNGRGTVHDGVWTNDFKRRNTASRARLDAFERI